MPTVSLVKPAGAPTDHLEIYLTAADPPSRASLLKLKSQLAAKWPVDDLQIRHVPLRLKNPFNPHTLGAFLGTAGHEIYIHFWKVVGGTASLLAIREHVRKWWGRNAKPSEKSEARKSGAVKRRKAGVVVNGKKSTVKLSTEQWEIVGQFNDISFEYPKLTFDQAAKKVFGAKPFPNTPSGRAFRREAKAIFDQEREL